MRKKLIGTLLITMLLGGGIVSCGEKEKTVDEDKNLVIRYAYQPSHSQLIIAEELGFFKEEFEKDNITLESKQFAAGPPIIEAFAAGELDFGMVGDQPAIQGRANNIDLKAIASYSSSEKGNALLATKKSEIKELKDLKGKKIGFTVGSVGHQLLLIYLETAGLNKEDVEMVNLSPSDIFTSLKSNNIDAAITWEPYISMAAESEDIIVVTDSTGYKYSVNLIVGNSEFLKKYPDVTARLLKVLDKSAKWSEEHNEESLDLIQKRSGITKEAMRGSFDKYDKDISLNEKRINSVEDTAKYLKENNIIRSEVKIEDLVDTSYLEAAGIK